MLGHDFNQSVFVNCPFDDDYQPLLQAVLFCIIDCDLIPRVATERLDSAEIRLSKIVELMRASRYSIHDLSRIKSSEAGEFARLNMPFELGIDYGLTISGIGMMESKRHLVLAEEKHEYQTALSDIAGWDIRAHHGLYELAIKQVRTWLQSHGLAQQPPSHIIGHYIDFQEWDYERLLADGWNQDDIKSRETGELLQAMNLWREAGRPATFT